jgi:hypothetical protein
MADVWSDSMSGFLQALQKLSKDQNVPIFRTMPESFH